MSWFVKPPQPPVQVRILSREATALRLHEFRADQRLTTLAAQIFSTPDMKLFLQVVENEHPGFLVLRDDVPGEVRAIAQARAEGYTLALANFRSLAIFEQPNLPIEETFEPQG